MPLQNFTIQTDPKFLILITIQNDTIDYDQNLKFLTITRNPFGFKNKIKKESGYQGVSNAKKNESGEFEFDKEFSSDDDFESKLCVWIEICQLAKNQRVVKLV